MSALGQKRTYAVQRPMSALLSIATAKADPRKRPCPLYPRKRTCRQPIAKSAIADINVQSECQPAGAASMIDTAELVGTTRRSVKPDSLNRLSNSTLLRSRAWPNMAIICTSTR